MEIVTDHAEYDLTVLSKRLRKPGRPKKNPIALKAPGKKTGAKRSRYLENKKYAPVTQAKNALEKIKAENLTLAEKKRRFLAAQDARYADWENENGSLARTVVSSDGTVTEVRGRLPIASNCHGRNRF